MIRKHSIIIVSVLVLGCQEDLDLFKEPSFTKVFGLQGGSFAADMIETREGNLVMVGRFDRVSLINSYEDETGSEDETRSGPYILMTDANGNELNFRHFHFTREELLERAKAYFDQGVIPNLEGRIKLSGGNQSFKYVRELQNGNFFVVGISTGTINGTFDNFHYFLILDPEFNPIKFQFFSNTQQELETMPGGRYITWRGPKPLIMNNGDGDILLLSNATKQDYFTPNQGYSVYRLTQDGDFVNIWDYSTEMDFSMQNETFIDSWVLDEEENLVLYGFYRLTSPEAIAKEDTFGDADMVLHKINTATGALVKKVKFGQGSLGFTFRGGIEATDDGFVVSDYHIDTVGELNDGTADDGFRNMYGGLWFVDQNLDSIGKKHITKPEVHWLGSELIKTRNGDYLTSVAIRSASGEELAIIRLDPNGEPLWEHRLDQSLNGALEVTMVETQDGGIVLWGHRDFNDMGPRITLLKLTADGNL